jgi:hypothetical protein
MNATDARIAEAQALLSKRIEKRAADASKAIAAGFQRDRRSFGQRTRQILANFGKVAAK